MNRAAEAKADSVAKAKKRENTVYRAAEAKADSERKRQKRENPLFKAAEAAAEADRKAKKRENTVYRAAEAKADCVAKTKERKCPLVRAAEADAKRRSRASKKKELSPKESIEEEKKRLLRNLKAKRARHDKAERLRDVSKVPSLPFSLATHKIEPELIKSVAKAKEFDQRTQRENGLHQANVCVVCDEFIFGTQPLKFIDESMLRSEETANRLSVARYQQFRGITLKETLVKKYELSGLKGLLLSPRSKRNSEQQRMCCNECYNSLMSSRSNSKRAGGDGEDDERPNGPGPPKKAIANGFLFGRLPTEFPIKGEDGLIHTVVVREEDLTDILCSFLSPKRPYGYVFAYTGGAHKSLRGSFFFYENDLEAVGGAMELFHTTGASPHVHAVLCGRMTPNQKKIARERAVVDTKILRAILTWFISESGHQGYNGLRVPSECPVPTIIEEKEGPHNTDISKDPEKETYAGSTFYFKGSNSPDPDTSVYKTNSDFVLAMVNNTMPTLLVHGGNMPI